MIMNLRSEDRGMGRPDVGGLRGGLGLLLSGRSTPVLGDALKGSGDIYSPNPGACWRGAPGLTCD